MQGCAGRIEAPPPATPTAIAVETRTPAPSELLRCPERPAGFPAGSVAVIPAPVRSAIMRLAQAFARNAEQLERLIAWERDGKACSSAEAAPAK